MTRQAQSIARRRAQRAKQNLCCDCGHAPRVRRRITSTGQIKTLTRCADCLAAQRENRY